MTDEEIAIVQRAVDEARATVEKQDQFVGITVKDGEIITIYWTQVRDNEILVGP